MPEMMPRDHLLDELDHIVIEFCNAMRRDGLKDLPPDRWLELFCSYLAGVDLGEQYRESLAWGPEMEPQ